MPIKPQLDFITEPGPQPNRNPFESFDKAAQYRNLLLTGQLHQQQIANEQEQLKGLQQKNAEMDRAQADSANFNALVREKGSIKAALDEAPKRGVRAEFLNKATDEYNKQVQSMATADKTQVEADHAKTDYWHETLAPIAAVTDPVQQGALLEAAQQRAVQAGIMDPKDVTPYAGPSQVADLLARNTLNKHLLVASDEKRKQDEAARKAAMGPAQQTEAEQKAISATQEATGTKPMQPKDIATLNREKARDQQISANEEALRKQGAQRVNIAQQELNLRKQQAGFEQNGGISDAAKMIAAGQMDPQTTRALLRRSPGIISQVKQVDPNFDEANIDNRFNTLKEFTSTSNGKAGGQVLALNTLIHHADLYQEAAKALKNGSFTPGNEIYNKVSALFGGPAPQNAALVARFLAGETGKVATGGVPAEGEIKGILSNLSTSASPEQIEGAGRKLLEIAAGRATPLMERAKQAKIDNVVQVLGPDAKEILKRHGFDPETMKPATPQAAPKSRIKILKIE